ncbi:MAG: hypothetical protein AB7R40_25490 [Nitrospiraceae bacterium]
MSVINKEYVKFHLCEVIDDATQLIAELEQRDDFELEELEVVFRGIFHHLNTAWNARFATADCVLECKESDFRAWRAFPRDIDMEL